MLVLAIWAALIGYSVLITGKRNMGINYQPQADGSIKAVDNQGKPAKTFGIADVLTCGTASGSLPGQPASSAMQPADQQAPPLDPNLFPFPVPGFKTVPNLPAVTLPAANPIPFPVPGILDQLAGDVRGILRPIVTGAESEWSKLRGQLSGLGTPRPLL